MPKADVIKLHDSVAICPECNCQHWFIVLDGFGDMYEKITAHKCVGCGFTVDIEIVRAPREENEDNSEAV